MRLVVLLLCCGLAAAQPHPFEDNPEDPDVDYMLDLLGEGLSESASSSSQHQQIDVDTSESSYFISTGGEMIKEITVAEAGDFGLTCLPAGALSQSADIIVQESVDESAAAAASAAKDAAASSAAAGGAAAAAAAGDAASSAAAAGGAASSAAAAGDAASSAAAAGDAASSAAAAGDTASSAAAAGDAASSAAAAGESASSAAAAGDAASSAAAAGDAASSAAAAGDAASSAAAAGDAASSAAAAGDAASSAAAAGDAASSAAAAGESASSAAAAGDAASSAAAAGDAASSAAAAGDAASSAAAAGDAASSAAAAGDAASSAAAAGGAASSAAAAGDSASSAAAAGGAASSAAAAGEASSSSSQLGYELEEGEESYSEEVEAVGECVPYYLCDEGNIVTDGAGLIDMRFGGDDEDSKSSSKCPNFLDVFCTAPLTEPDSDILEELTEYEYEPSCGHRNPEGVSIILDGFKDGESQFGEFPWMGIILEDELIDYDQVIKRYVCGASLIHPQVVMTGAHCINGKDATKLSVRLGDWDTQNEKEIFPHEEHRVVSMEVHERFNAANLRYDIGLLFLEEPVQLQQHIDTICLPQKNENFDHANCVATGYGKDQFHGGRFQNIMKQVDLPVVPHRECQNRLRTTRLGRWFRLHRTFTCAGGVEGVDVCRGDGGSPYVCPSKEDPTKYVQVGIVAWGIGCGEGGIPGVYGSVPKMVDWVHAKMTEHGFGQPSKAQRAYKSAPPV